MKSLKTKVLALAFLTGGMLLSFLWMSTPSPTFNQVKESYQVSDTLIVDADGFPLGALRTSKNNRSLTWTSWKEISPSFKDLLVEVEDKRFYSHIGIDIFALGQSLKDYFSGHSLRGASTLSMQLAGLVNKSLQGRRGFGEKLKQIFWALKAETHWSKEEILEAYVNLVSFRGELRGLRAASLGYFQKAPEGLISDEAALLIALIRSPNATAEKVANRSCKILKYKDCDPIQNFTSQTLNGGYRIARSREIVPVVNDKFILSSGDDKGLIKTSLDRKVQNLALRAMQDQLRNLKQQNVNDAAVLVLETKTGRVVAYAANAGPGYTSGEQIDGVQMRRQAGSTIKPFVYATAFEWNLLTPISLLEDSPADIPISQGRVYHPRNYDLSFRGIVGVGDALASSLNVPAVRALRIAGEDRVLESLMGLGFDRLESSEFYGPSLALGTLDVSLWELTQGYRQFGVDNEVFSKQTRESIFQILSAPEHRRYTFGLDSVLNLPFAAAVKTGTSKDMRDNWCIGWTEDYTVGVWVGNFDGQPMWNVSGVTGAAPIWRELMYQLHPHAPKARSRYLTPVEPLAQRSQTRIRYPVAGMTLGLDPEIPAEVQKLPIEIDNPQQNHQLFLNETLLGKSKATHLWPIKKKGQYNLALKSADGKLIDEVKFEVR